jgi:hypothetical protein
LVDSIDELRVGLDEVGSRLLGIFELANLSGESEPFAFERPGIEFGRVLPGMLSRSQPGGTGLEVIAVPVSGKESTVGILDAAADLFVGSARKLEILVACSNGHVRPPSGTGPEVGQVLVQDGLPLPYLGEQVGDVRRDAPHEFSMLGTKFGEALGGSSLVRGPLLPALVIPGPDETMGGLCDVRCGGVDVARASGAAHGHIGELPATTVVEDVGDLDRRSLGAMTSDGVAVGETVGADVVEPHLKLTAVGGDSGECLGLGVDGGDPRSL